MLLMSEKLEKQLRSFDEKSEVGKFKKSSRPACRLPAGRQGRQVP